MDEQDLYIDIGALQARSSERGCLLVVDFDTQKLDLLVMRLVAGQGWAHVSVGSELGALLLGVAASDRPRAVQRWARDRLRQHSTGPTLCNRLDLLFEPSLALDPLRLLQQAGRSALIVATWPGSYDGNVLAYGVPEHGHHRRWTRPDVPIVCLG